MPEESINIFISNIYTAAIFTGVLTIIFVLLFIISRIVIFRAKKDEKHLKPEGHPTAASSSLLILNKDINLLKNLFTAGLIFILTIFFIMLLLLSFYLAKNFKMDSSLYMLVGIIFLILAISVYVVKSRITER